MSTSRRSLPLIVASSALAVAAVTTAAPTAVAEARPLTAAQLSAEKPSAAAAHRARHPARTKSATRRHPVHATNATRRRTSGVPCDAYAAACVSLSRQEAWLMRGGRVVYGPVRIASGRAGMRTPTGDFRVFYKVVDGWSYTYDAPMPYSIYFYEGDAFHADPVTVPSHGCIHLSLRNAEYFYRFLHYGDLVEVRR